MESRGEAIVLVGFMGTGKSSVGRELERRTRLPRYDTDELVTKRFGLPIAQIFSQFGEQLFRDAEAETLAQLPDQPGIIVSGGGLLLRAGHLQKVRSLGLVVQLAGDIETLVERLSRRPNRPLLQTPNPRATIEELLRARQPLYTEAADATVDTTGKTHEEVADAVLAEVERVRSHAS
jgi:shikimate kinase